VAVIIKNMLPKVALAFLMFSSCLVTEAQSHSTERQHADVIARATGLALQGDAAAAAKLLEQSQASFSGEDALFRSCMVQRFGSVGNTSRLPELPISDSWMFELSTAYLAYWHQALQSHEKRQSAETELKDKLVTLLGEDRNARHEFDQLEESVRTAASRRG